jgi:hypothetical protein
VAARRAGLPHPLLAGSPYKPPATPPARARAARRRRLRTPPHRRLWRVPSAGRCRLIRCGAPDGQRQRKSHALICLTSDPAHRRGGVYVGRIENARLVEHRQQTACILHDQEVLAVSVEPRPSASSGRSCLLMMRLRRAAPKARRRARMVGAS